MYLISPQKKQYKANLHCHSTLSDGRKTPDELKAMYKSHGYSILAITDHERPCDHSALTEVDFLMITGYEGYIRPSPTCTYDIFKPEVHLNLFAREPHNQTLICHNKYSSSYLYRDHAMDDVQRAGSERLREYSVEYVNEYIRTARENGYLVAYNHPNWSMESEADVLAYEGCFSMEICNYGAYVDSGLEYNGAVYDKMLRAGKRIFCHGADDNHNAWPTNHPNNDSFGAFTMIMPDSFTYQAVIVAMEKGEMYASMGPTFKAVTFDGKKLHVDCSDVAHIFVYFGSKVPRHLHCLRKETVNSADFEIHPASRYIRVSIVDHQGRWADTRAFTRTELGLSPLEE